MSLPTALDNFTYSGNAQNDAESLNFLASAALGRYEEALKAKKLGKEKEPRPMNRWLVFRTVYLAQGDSHFERSTKSKRASKAWSKLLDESKNAWEIVAMKFKDAHAAEYLEYKYQPVRKRKTVEGRRGGNATTDGIEPGPSNRVLDDRELRRRPIVITSSADMMHTMDTPLNRYHASATTLRGSDSAGYHFRRHPYLQTRQLQITKESSMGEMNPPVTALGMDQWSYLDDYAFTSELHQHPGHSRHHSHTAGESSTPGTQTTVPPVPPITIDYPSYDPLMVELGLEDQSQYQQTYEYTPHQSRRSRRTSTVRRQTTERPRSPFDSMGLFFPDFVTTMLRPDLEEDHYPHLQHIAYPESFEHTQPTAYLETPEHTYGPYDAPKIDIDQTELVNWMVAQMAHKDNPKDPQNNMTFNS